MHVRVLLVGSLKLFEIELVASDTLAKVKQQLRHVGAVKANEQYRVYGASKSDGSWVYGVRDNLAPLAFGDKAAVAAYVTPESSLPTKAKIGNRIHTRFSNMVQLLVVINNPPAATELAKPRPMRLTVPLEPRPERAEYASLDVGDSEEEMKREEEEKKKTEEQEEEKNAAVVRAPATPAAHEDSDMLALALMFVGFLGVMAYATGFVSTARAVISYVAMATAALIVALIGVPYAFGAAKPVLALLKAVYAMSTLLPLVAAVYYAKPYEHDERIVVALAQTFPVFLKGLLEALDEMAWFARKP